MAFRDGPFENIKVPLIWTAGVVVVIAGVLSVMLLLGGQRDVGDEPASPVKSGFAAAAGPVGGVFAAPVRWAGAVTDYIGGYFFAVSENRKLKAELAELQPWRDQAIALKNVNARYEAMLGLRTEPPIAMVTARSVSEARGPFVNARLIDVGTDRGVRIGNPVLNEHGLVGKVVGASGGVSRLLLLTDVASRTPVLIDRTDARAMLTGDGSGNPRLEYVRGAGAVKAGDRVLTSGDGGGIPRGVPIGVVAKGIDGTWRVKLFSDRGAIDYVRVMLFQDFGQLADPNALNAPPLAALGTAPAPSETEVALINDVAARRAAAAEATRAEVARAEAARVEAARTAAAPPPAPATPRPAAAQPSSTPTTRPQATQPAATQPAATTAARPARRTQPDTSRPYLPAPATRPATTPPSTGAAPDGGAR